jgi:hypothetical protein
MADLQIRYDTKKQPYIEWEQAPGGYKRAWIQTKDPNSQANWAKVPDGRYLNVVRVEGPDQGSAGNATDFPVFSDLSSEQVLKAFVMLVCAITGTRLP